MMVFKSRKEMEEEVERRLWERQDRIRLEERINMLEERVTHLEYRMNEPPEDVEVRCGM